MHNEQLGFSETHSHCERKMMDAIRCVADPTGHRSPQRKVHLDISHVQRAPVAVFWTELNVPINDAVFVVGIAKFKAK